MKRERKKNESKEMQRKSRREGWDLDKGDGVDTGWRPGRDGKRGRANRTIEKGVEADGIRMERVRRLRGTGERERWNLSPLKPRDHSSSLRQHCVALAAMT